MIIVIHRASAQLLFAAARHTSKGKAAALLFPKSRGSTAFLFFPGEGRRAGIRLMWEEGGFFGIAPVAIGEGQIIHSWIRSAASLF